MLLFPCDLLIETDIALIDKTRFELWTIEQMVFLALFTGFGEINKKKHNQQKKRSHALKNGT